MKPTPSARSLIRPLLLALTLAACPPGSRAATAEHVVQVSLDGLGSVYLSGYLATAPGQFPNFVRLMNEGAYTLNARCDYDISETVPNHVCMFTARPVFQPAGFPDTTHHGYDNNFPGAAETIHNAGNLNVPYKSSMFDVAHDHGLSTAFYAGKTRLEICNRSYDEFNGALDLTGADDGQDKIDVAYVVDVSGTAITNEVNELIANLTGPAPARYTFIHIAEPDLTGHGSGWGSVNWSNAVRLVDAQLGRILEAVETQPALAGRTALIVTADHGGGGVNLRGHTESYHQFNFIVPFFLWGPQVPAGEDLYELMINRGDPGTNWVDYAEVPQPIRNSDASNLALGLLGLPPIPDSFMLPELGGLGVRLAMRLVAGQIEVSWNDPSSSYVLEHRHAAADPLVWETLPSGVVHDGSHRSYHVANGNGEGAVFFRLRQLPFGFSAHPQSLTVHAGDSALLEVQVVATTESPLSYQWTKDGAPVPGANGPQLNLASVELDDAGSYAVEVSDGVDTAHSCPATLTVLFGPIITQQPTSQTVLSNAPVMLVVAAEGATPLTYQWRKDGEDLDGATGATLDIPAMDFDDVGTYTVVVSDPNGSVESDPAVLNIVVPLAFVQRPASQSVPVGGTATFTVVINGYPPPFTYTWRKVAGATLTNEVSNATTSTITLNNVQSSDAGNYQVIVKSTFNTTGIASLPFAALTVTQP